MCIILGEGQIWKVNHLKQNRVLNISFKIYHSLLYVYLFLNDIFYLFLENYLHVKDAITTSLLSVSE